MPFGHEMHVPCINKIYMGPEPCLINPGENHGKHISKLALHNRRWGQGGDMVGEFTLKACPRHGDWARGFTVTNFPWGWGNFQKLPQSSCESPPYVQG